MLGVTIPRKGRRAPLLPLSLRRNCLADNTQTIKDQSFLKAQPNRPEVKVILGHLRSDPSTNPMNLFKYLVPVWTIGCVMALISWLSQQKHTRLLKQRAASVLGDIAVSDVEWGSTIKPFLWAVFGGPLFIFLVLGVLTHWIGRPVKENPNRSWDNEDNSRLQSSETRSKGAWELKGADVYSGIFWT
jgi:hypothetical protein